MPRRRVYVFGRLTGDGFQVEDAAGAVHYVSGYLACVDGRAAVRARWVRDARGLTRVRFADGQECWVKVELPGMQVEDAA